jgi:hypothetical protein
MRPPCNRTLLIAGVVVIIDAAIQASAATPNYKAPRTEWGTPDLQGNWTNTSVTPLERDDKLRGKPTLTKEEAAEYLRTNILVTRKARDLQPSVAAVASNDPGGYNEFWQEAGERLAVVNGEIRTSWIVDPPNGKVPYTQDALAAMKVERDSASLDGPEGRPIAERCVMSFGPTAGPPMLPDMYNNYYQIVQTKDAVVILSEMIHDARIVRIGGKHIPKQIARFMGDSIGRWEGDTLVVETTNLHPAQKIQGGFKQRFYLPPTGKVTERFTRVAADEILYQFTVEDATAYTQPWRGEMPMRASPDRIYEYACHEGNYALPGILAGARADEKSAAEKGSQTPSASRP